MTELLVGGIYRHYKNKRYKVIGTAKHSETLEDMVIYEAQYENSLGKTWVRPLNMFLENVKTENYMGPRFTLELAQEIRSR